MDHSTENEESTKQEELEKPLLRDESELEGALLPPQVVPTAVPVAAAKTNAANDSTAVAVASITEAALSVPTVGPITYFEYEQKTGGGGDANGDDDVDATILREAPTIPSYYDGCTGYNPQRERDAALLVTRDGLAKTDDEIVDIGKQNRNVYAKNYFVRQDVEVANQRAAVLKRAEETGRTQTSALAAKDLKGGVPPPPAPKEDPEHFQGTYGKEYEVAEYQSGYNYDTTEYDVAEYKSIYES